MSARSDVTTDAPRSRLLRPDYLTGRDRNSRRVGAEGGARDARDTNVQEALYQLQREINAGDKLMSQRPPNERKFSGEGSSVDFEATLHQFDLVTSIPGVTEHMKFLEYRHWFKGPALAIIGLYESVEDPKEANKQIRRHLIRDFGSRHISAQQMMDVILAGKQITAKDAKGLYTLILELEKVYRKARDTGKEHVFDNKDSIETVIMRRVDCLSRKWTDLCAKRSMKEDLDLDKEGSNDDDDEHDKSSSKFDLKFKDLIYFLRYTHRQLVHNSSYQVKKARDSGHISAALAVETPVNEDAVTEAVAALQVSTKGLKNARNMKKKAATSKPPEAGKRPITVWTCAACGTTEHHLLETCSEFLKLTLSEKKKLARAKGLCMNCLKGSHIAKDCTQKPCPTCSKPHHKVMHPTDTES